MAKENKKKSCFVIGPIGQPDSPTRIWADELLKYVIIPVVKDFGYAEPLRADQISQPGLITMQIIQHLINDDLIVADLTEQNANVYYELAVRHVSRKPFIQLMRQGDRIPFDTKDVRTILIGTGLGASGEAIDKLKQCITDIEKHGSHGDNPITAAVDLELMRASGDTQQKTLADLLEKFEDMRSDFLQVALTLADGMTILMKGQEGARSLVDIFAEGDILKSESYRQAVKKALKNIEKKAFGGKISAS